MKIEDEFHVDVPVDEAWKVLLDVERIAPCMPGAQLQEIEGDEYRGIVKVKVGPITAQYKGAARIVETDEAAHHAGAQGRGSRHARSGQRVGHRHRHAHARRQRHARAHRHRPQHHRQGRAVRPRRDGRRVEQAARPVRVEPRARRAERQRRRGRAVGRWRDRVGAVRTRRRASSPAQPAAGGGARRSTRPSRSRSTCSTRGQRGGEARRADRDRCWSRCSPSARCASAASARSSSTTRSRTC